MGTPHVHSECIKAWADGKQIQYYSDSLWNDWRDVVENFPQWSPNVKYRVKPDTIRYRVALFRGGTVSTNSIDHAERMARSPGFKRWLTDWKEEEV